MEFDPVIAGVLAVMVGLISYMWYLHNQRKAPLPDLTSLAPLYESELFTAPLGEREAYVEAKKAELRKAGREESEVSVSDVGADGRKVLNGLLLKRAIAAIDRAVRINAELENVKALQANALINPQQVDEIQRGIKVIEAEHGAIRQEADVLRHNWGAVIFAQAHDMSIGLERRKQSRRQQEEGGSDAAEKEDEGKRREDELPQEDVEAMQARLAGQAYQRLMLEEYRRKALAEKKKDKDRQDTNSKKGSKK